MTIRSASAGRRFSQQPKLEKWPMIDQELWAQATEAGDILSPSGAAAKWAAGTCKAVVSAYGRWLAWLAFEKRLDEQRSPAARADPENVAAFVAHLRIGRASTTVWTTVHSLAMALMVMEPSADIAWLWEIERRLGRIKVPTRRKAERVVPVQELYRFGCELMEDASSLDASSLEGARLYRNGLMIAMLAARPIRMRNLRSIAIGHHLIKLNGAFYLRFTADETKTHKALDFPIPKELTSRIEIYLSKYRPTLLGRRRPPSWIGEEYAPGDALWISMFGTAMGDFAIYTAISDLTRKRFGRHVNPHLFRDCAATSIALEDPSHVEITTSILGHACLSTSERYYNHALSVRAVGLHQAEILATRNAARHSQRHASVQRKRSAK